MGATHVHSLKGESDINRLAIVVLTSLANLVGLVPSLLLLNSPGLLMVFTVSVSLVGSVIFYITTGSKSKATYKPTILEYSLAGLGAIFASALLGFLWLVLYGIAYLIVMIAIRLISSWQITPDSAAIIFSTIVAAVIALPFFIATATSMANQLYPETAGVKSAFHPFLTQERRRLLGCSSFAAIFLTLAMVLYPVLRGSFDSWFYFGLEVYLLVVTAPLYTAEVVADRLRDDANIVEMIADLLQIAGYSVELNPRTLDEKVDPLLINLDLAAIKGNHHLFAQVKTGGQKDTQANWKNIFELLQATWALSEYHGIEPEKADPQLILVDVDRDKVLIKAGKKQGVKLLFIASEDIHRVHEFKNEDMEDKLEAVFNLLDLQMPQDKEHLAVLNTTTENEADLDD